MNKAIDPSNIRMVWMIIYPNFPEIVALQLIILQLKIHISLLITKYPQRKIANK